VVTAVAGGLAATTHWETRLFSGPVATRESRERLFALRRQAIGNPPGRAIFGQLAGAIERR